MNAFWCFLLTKTLPLLLFAGPFCNTALAAGLPSASMNSTTMITASSVRLNGSVNGNGSPTSVTFEYGESLTGDQFPWTALSSPSVVSGNSSVYADVSANLYPGTYYRARIRVSNLFGTRTSNVLTFRTLAPPEPVIGTASAVTSHSAHVTGTVHPRDSETTVVFEYGTDGVNFPGTVAAMPGTINGGLDVSVAADITGLLQGSTIYYRIRATSAGGTSTSTASSFVLGILSGYARQFPNTPPSASGGLTVTLFPSGLLSGWRFIGEPGWRASGQTATGLVAGDREIEFRPIPGYLQPGPEPVIITPGAQTADFEYYATPAAGTGGLIVVLKPDSIAQSLQPADRAQWRLLGENDTAWRDSGTLLGNLGVGSYLVECKPLAGLAAPPLANIIINSGQMVNPTLVYVTAASPSGAQPQVLDFNTVPTDASKPYGFAGQLRSHSGSGSGFAVKDRVVATAAHVVFDEGTLSSVQGLQWLHQQHAGVFEPIPAVPRGYYLIDGYASQRLSETPGSFSLASRHLDAAALYFLNNLAAARTGYSGYLASDLDSNEHLLSNASKMLIGYPLDGIPAQDQGRMHATVPSNLVFTSLGTRVFSTTGIGSTGGNSGGPLCVQHTDGTWYPAAIYLGGATQTIVRAIDSTLIQLFNSAQQSGIDDQGFNNGGATHTGYIYTGTASTGALAINITPAGTGWRPVGSGKPFTPSGSIRTNLTPGTFFVEFTPVSGYQTPAHQPVEVISSGLQTYSVIYQPSQTPQETWRQTYFGTTANSGSAADTFDYDKDGFTNAAEYAAGTNPTLATDRLQALNPRRVGNSFSVNTGGKSGRTYTLQRSTNLSSWSTVATQGPLSYDASLTLTDPTSPGGAGFYRIVVTGPAD
jgi:hypothetical protein